MAAEKFIRVTVQLPLGVGVLTRATQGARQSSFGGRYPALEQAFASLGVEERSYSSSGPLTLEIECPAAKRDELIAALASLVRDLNAS